MIDHGSSRRFIWSIATEIIRLLISGSQGRDLGQRVEISSGIKSGDQVILNPPVELAEGSRVWRASRGQDLLIARRRAPQAMLKSYLVARSAGRPY
jgi:hypothetical protein